MNSVDIKNTVLDMASKTVHMSLGTVSDSRPWVCEVHFALDDNLNIYFVSLESTRHCLDIAENPSVAGNIVRQHSLTEPPNGLYFEGLAHKVIEPTEDLIKNYCNILGRDEAKVIADLSGQKSMYCIKVENWAVFGNVDGNGYKKHVFAWSSHES